jgi:hypothetical protein
MDTIANTEKPTITWRDIVNDVRERLLFKQIIPLTTYLQISDAALRRYHSKVEAIDLGEVGAFKSREAVFSQIAAESITKREPCRVCAIGALMVGLMDVDECALANANLGEKADRPYFIQALRPYFDRDDLYRMEKYFEGWADEDDPDYREKLREWIPLNKTERLEKILDNIEANNGRFLP